jgi:hypothetical protein
MHNFKQHLNPFVGMSVDELTESYVYFSAVEDSEAVSLVADAYDADIYMDLRSFGNMDLRSFGIGSSDFP